MDKCSKCEGDLAIGMKRVVTQGEDIRIVEGVPCFKCTQCGHTSLTPEVIAQISEIAKEDPPLGLTAVRVIPYHVTSIAAPQGE